MTYCRRELFFPSFFKGCSLALVDKKKTKKSDNTLVKAEKLEGKAKVSHSLCSKIVFFNQYEDLLTFPSTIIRALFQKTRKLWFSKVDILGILSTQKGIRPALPCLALTPDARAALSNNAPHRILAYLSDEILKTAPWDLIIVLLECFCQVRIENLHAYLRQSVKQAGMRRLHISLVGLEPPDFWYNNPWYLLPPNKMENPNTESKNLDGWDGALNWHLWV